jgi:hypothetical protein
MFLTKYFPQQPLLVWYEKLTLTLVFVLLGLGFFARTKPTKMFVTMHFCQNISPVLVFPTKKSLWKKSA